MRPEVLQTEKPGTPLVCEVNDQRRSINERMSILVKRLEGFGLIQTAQAAACLRNDIEKVMGDDSKKERVRARTA